MTTEATSLGKENRDPWKRNVTVSELAQVVYSVNRLVRKVVFLTLAIQTGNAPEFAQLYNEALAAGDELVLLIKTMADTEYLAGDESPESDLGLLRRMLEDRLEELRAGDSSPRADS